MQVVENTDLVGLLIRLTKSCVLGMFCRSYFRNSPRKMFFQNRDFETPQTFAAAEHVPNPQTPKPRIVLYFSNIPGNQTGPRS